jgi:ABC-type Fe3+-hydroxamate transport system substrate-binding protein
MVRRTLAPLLVLLAAGLCVGAAPAEPARRVVSMNPSLTSILVAIGATSALVGVEEHAARSEPAVRELPVVGGLFHPSLEAVVALEPDLVVTVPGAQQSDLRLRLEALGIAVLELPNVTWDEILASIEVLGAHVGREDAARDVVARLRGARAEMRGQRAGRAPVRGVLVLQRDPLYVVGRGSFLDDMLTSAGVVNLGAEFDEPYPRTGVEWLVAAAPELILDAAENVGPPAAYWSRWPSLPAVKSDRVVAIPAGPVTLPGPHLDRALALLAAAVGAP